MMDWARMLVYFAGTVDEELLLLNEHLAAENRIPRAQTKGRLLLSDAEKAALADIGHRRGRKVLVDVANAHAAVRQAPGDRQVMANCAHPS